MNKSFYDVEVGHLFTYNGQIYLKVNIDGQFMEIGNKIEFNTVRLYNPMYKRGDCVHKDIGELCYFDNDDVVFDEGLFNPKTAQKLIE